MIYVRRVDIIKIMPCVEGDRSDCQPEASSNAQGRKSDMHQCDTMFVQ